MQQTVILDQVNATEITVSLSLQSKPCLKASLYVTTIAKRKWGVGSQALRLLSVTEVESRLPWKGLKFNVPKPVFILFAIFIKAHIKQGNLIYKLYSLIRE